MHQDQSLSDEQFHIWISPNGNDTFHRDRNLILMEVKICISNRSRSRIERHLKKEETEKRNKKRRRGGKERGEKSLTLPFQT